MRKFSKRKKNVANPSYDFNQLHSQISKGESLGARDQFFATKISVLFSLVGLI